MNDQKGILTVNISNIYLNIKNSNIMIKINHISFEYPGRKHPVFEDLSFSLESNHICGLLGKNGMGKSTLLYLISGLLRPKSGEILVDGVPSKDRRLSVLQDIFIVPEEYDMPPVTLREFVKMNEVFYPHFNIEVLRNCLRDFELSEEPNLKELSMGQKKKIYMSFALASGTRYLLMDEPTNGLDIPSKSLFRKVVAQNVTEGSTLIISTHQVHDLESLLDHIIILDNSHILVNSSVADITGKYTFSFRSAQEMDDVLYAEPSFQGNAAISLRKPEDEETTLNLELFFNAATKGRLNY